MTRAARAMKTRMKTRMNAHATATEFGNLTLAQAQQLAWLRQDSPPATSREALGRLLEMTRICLESFDQEQIVAAQKTLEDALVQALIAMKSLDVNPDQALGRALERLKRSAGQRAFHILSDRVEIRSQGEVRGEWALYSQHDYQQALNLARELGCEVIHEDACQLGLFRHVRRAD